MTEQNMNEQIRELAERAGAVTFGGKVCLFGDHDIEKFAELIVRECGEVAWRHTPETEELEYSHLIRSKILEHFGVKE
jgi:hypothetical protein